MLTMSDRKQPLGFLHVIYGPKTQRVDIGPAAQMPPERLARQPLIACESSLSVQGPSIKLTFVITQSI